MSRIEAGIEWFPDGYGGEDCQCARCGSSAIWDECWECGGEGGHMGDDPLWDLGDWIRCSSCHGRGGWWRCCSGREWCKAHPMAGREEIASTALDREDAA